MDSFSLHAFGPLFVFVSVLAAAVGLPVPALPALIFAGSITAGPQGGTGLLIADFLAALLGVALGDSAWFVAGRHYGFRVLRLLCRISLSRDTCVRRTEGFFERRGVRLLLVARFVPGLSLVSVPMSGFAAVPYFQFVRFDLAGASLWAGLGLLIGNAFAGQIDTVLGFLQHFGIGVAKIAAAIVAGYVSFRWLHRQHLLRQLRINRISVDELHALMAAEPAPVIIDVRSREGRRADPYRIPGARTVDLQTRMSELADLGRHNTVIVYCACPNEASAAELALRLHKLGFSHVRPLLGGLDAWRKAGREVHALLEPGAGTTVVIDTGMSTAG